MELIVVAAIQHAINLQDVGISICSREFISSAIEAQDKLLPCPPVVSTCGIHSFLAPVLVEV